MSLTCCVMGSRGWRCRLETAKFDSSYGGRQGVPDDKATISLHSYLVGPADTRTVSTDLEVPKLRQGGHLPEGVAKQRSGRSLSK